MEMCTLSSSMVFFSPCTRTMLAGRTRSMKLQFCVKSTCAAKDISSTLQSRLRRNSLG